MCFPFLISSEGFGNCTLDVLLPEIVLLTFDAESHLLVAEVNLCVALCLVVLLNMGEVLRFLVDINELGEKLLRNEVFMGVIIGDIDIIGEILGSDPEEELELRDEDENARADK